MGLKCCTNPKSFPLRDGHSDGDADSDPISIQFRLRSSVFVFRDRASSPRTAHCQLCLSVPDRDMPDRDRVGVGYRRVFCISTTFGRYYRYSPVGSESDLGSSRSRARALASRSGSPCSMDQHQGVRQRCQARMWAGGRCERHAETCARPRESRRYDMALSTMGPYAFDTMRPVSRLPQPTHGTYG